MTPPSVELLPGSVLASAGGAAWAWGLGVLLGAAVLGAIEQRIGRDAGTLPAADRLLGWAVLGMPLQAAAWLLASRLGLARPGPLVAGAVALTLVGAWAGGRRVVAALREIAATDGDRGARRDVVRLAALAVVASTVLLAAWLTRWPTTYYDDLVYHLGLPLQALMTGAWPALPHFHYAWLPAGWDATYLLPLALGGGSGPQLMNVGALVLFAWATWRLARRGASAGAAGAATALLVASPVLLSLGSLAGNDLFVGLALVVALDRTLRSEASPGAAGLVAGAAWAAKYTALPAIAGLALVRGLAPGVTGTRRLRDGGILVLAALVPALPWTLRTTLGQGNPVYPAFFRWLGGSDWTSESAALVARDAAHGAVADRGPLALLAAPWELLARPHELGDPAGLNLVFLPVALLGLAAARRVQGAARLGVFVLVVHLGWCLTSLNLRYALVLLAALTPFAAAALATAVETAGASRRRAWLAAGLLAVAAAGPLVSGVRRHLERRAGGASLLDDAPRGEVLPRLIHLAAAGRDLDLRLSPDARLLLVGEARLALLPRPAVASSAYDRPAVGAFLEAPSPTAAAREGGVTHVVVNERELARWRAQYDWDERLPAGDAGRLEEWLDALPVAGRWGSVVVREIPPPDDDVVR